MFTGWSAHNLDVKGRVAIPARFRDVLKTKSDERVVVTTGERCLVAYPYEDWQTIAEKIGRQSQVDPRVLAFRRYFISGATECTLDKQGRVLIPPPLRELADLDGQVMLVGMQTTFELWNKERWYEERARIQENFGDLSSFMAELGI